jgi:hypothetical protein
MAPPGFVYEYTDLGVAGVLACYRRPCTYFNNQCAPWQKGGLVEFDAHFLGEVFLNTSAQLVRDACMVRGLVTAKFSTLRWNPSHAGRQITADIGT